MNRTRWIGWLVMCLAAGAAAGQLTPDQEQRADKLLRDQHEVLASMRWPGPDQTVGFKTLSLGGPFDLNGIAAYSYYYEKDRYELAYHRPATPGSDEHAYVCKGNLPILFTCNLGVGPESRNSPAIMDLITAFGESVHVKLMVIPSDVMSVAAIRSRQFGMGRIVEIFLENKNPSASFQKAAVAHFNDVFHQAPVVSVKYKNPQEVYSRDCQIGLMRIAKIPESQMTGADRSLQSKCDAEANLAVLSGKMVAGRTTTSTWRRVGEPYWVDVTAVEQRIMANNVAVMPVGSSVVIGMHVDTDKTGAAVHALQAAYENREKAATDVQKQTDF